MLGGLFGKKKPMAPPPTLGEASERLDKRGDNIDQKIAAADAELAKIREELGRTRGPAQTRLKQRATHILRQRKMLEQQRTTIFSQQLSVGQLAFTAETVKDATQQVAALKDASKGLKKEMKKIKIDDVDRLQDELEDLTYDAKDITDALGRNYGVPEVDDAELNAELDALGAEVAADPGYLDALRVPPGPVAAPARPQGVTSEADRLEQQLGL